ncbi:glycosyltransferase [Vibrio breoganii]|uniref:glycosyltransferase n=1 Tax=Vibrio breoganii TaxID=553239 RepID=UPI000C83ED44|nr:glycosyltransferase [Vibrio breoganii]PMG97749.1 hypothetical protein BCU80_18340 [Vibrio breoganii]
MKIINALSCKVGGGIQVFLSIINEIAVQDRKDFILLVDKDVHSNIRQSIPIEYEVIVPRYNKVLIRNLYLNRIVAKYDVNVVFSVFGPVYWRPSCKHLVGFALPWMVYEDSPAFHNLTTVARLKKSLFNLFRRAVIKYESDHIWVETNDVKCRLASILKIERKDISVISNTISNEFINGTNKSSLSNVKGRVKFLFLSSYYPHKNFEVFKKIKEKYRSNIIIYVTLTEQRYNELFSGYEDYIYNIGPVKVSECKYLYENVDAIIQPSYLECFSANYVEAIYCGKPLLVSDLPFARGICKEAAFYFEVGNSNESEGLNKLLELIVNRNQFFMEEFNKRRTFYPHVLASLDTAKIRSDKVLNIIELLASSRV